MTRAAHRGPRVPRVDVAVGGRPLEALEPDLREVTLVEDVDALNMITVVLHNWDPVRRAYRWSDSSRLSLGAELRVTVGLADDPASTQTHSGEVVGLEPRFAAGEAPTLTVRCYDVRHRLSRGVRTRSFSRMTDGDIVRQVASGAGVRVEAAHTGPRHDYVLQGNQTDLEFLAGRARLIGYELFSANGVVLFRPPPDDRPRSLVLAVGDDMTEFTPRLRAVTGTESSTVRGWDVVNKRVLVGRADRPTPTGGARAAPTGTTGRPRTGASVAVDVPVRTKDLADRIAAARRDERADTQIEAEAECPGRPDLRAGTVVEVTEAGERFSGPYYVTSATHEISAEGYRVRLAMRRWVA